MSSLSHELLLVNVYRIIYMSIVTKRKSKFDLSEFAHCKIPLDQYNALKKIADNTNIHWSELARMILAWWINTGKKVVGE